jgi:hypothetical protein
MFILKTWSWYVFVLCIYRICWKNWWFICFFIKFTLNLCWIWLNNITINSINFYINLTDIGRKSCPNNIHLLSSNWSIICSWIYYRYYCKWVNLICQSTFITQLIRIRFSRIQIFWDIIFIGFLQHRLIAFNTFITSWAYHILRNILS